MKKKPVSKVKKPRSVLVHEMKSDMLALNEEDVGIDTSIDRDTVAKIAGLIAAAATVFAVGPVSGAIVAALAVVALFVPDLFPEDAFSPLSGRILELIGSEIEKAQRESAIAQANARVSENVKLIKEVLNDFEIWEKTSDAVEKERKKIRLQAHYIALTRDYGAKLTGDFTRADFGGALVSQYVSSASLYLPVLRSYYKYANELDLAVRHDNVDLQGSVLARLRKDIAEFTDTAVGLYNSGKKKIIEGGEKKRRTWDDFNDYRNTMTLTALDLLPAFAYLDPLLYPTGCHPRYLNRKLVTEFDTYKVKSDKSKRYDILRYDSYYYFVREVTSLKSFRLFYGYFETGSWSQMHDGLYATQCTISSTDGYAILRALSTTGKKNPGPGWRSEKSFTIGTACFSIEGTYSTYGRSPTGHRSPYRVVSTIVSMTFIFGSANDGNYFSEFKFVNGNITGPTFFRFSQSIPTVGNSPLLPSNFSERLVDFDSHYVGTGKRVFLFVLSWRHKTVLQDLLPERNHVVNAALNPVEPFHAIRAGKSIWDGKLELIESPGFTGGDLVQVAPRTSLKFYLKRNPARWFSGAYQVRLWYVNIAFPGDVTHITVRCTPDDGWVRSALIASIPALTVRPNLSDLKYSDLLSYTFSGSVLLAAGMPGFELSFENNSLVPSILVDRIELIFLRFASFEETPV